MLNITESQLLDELRRRFEEKSRLMAALERATVELQAVNEKLMASESLKGHFLSNIRNEINNPLTAILGLSENLASDEETDPASVQAMARLIYQEAFNLDFQLRTIFAAAEIEAGEARVHGAEIDMPRFMRRVIDSFRHQLSAKSLDVAFDPRPLVTSGGERFSSDPEKLHLILAHLLSNAIEYSPQGQVVDIEMALHDGVLLATFVDRGPGIAFDDQQRIFDRFVQLDTGLTKRHRGHGLGLAVARGAAELLSGSLELESQVGKGSRFTARIPQLASAQPLNIYAIDGNEELF